MGKTEDVVHEEEHVLPHLVAKVLGHGEPGEGDPHTGSRGLVHLTVDKSDLGLRDVFLVDDAGFGHFRIEVVPFTGALPYPGEYGVSAVRLGDVVDELHDDDRLAHAGATEGTDLSSLDEGADEIDDLDARLENVGLGILFEECRGLPVDGAGFLVSARPEVVDRIARYVEDPAEDLLPYGYGNGGARIDDFGPPHQSLGGRHGHGPYPVVSQVLLRFQDELLLFLRIRALVADLKSVVDLGVEPGGTRRPRRHR